MAIEIEIRTVETVYNYNYVSSPQSILYHCAFSAYMRKIP